MAINNPYVPGDPYSYDLNWIISKIKTLDTIYESIDSKIAEQIYKAFQESNLINFKTTEEMLQATLEDGAVVLTDGYHEPGDGGTMIYLIQGFTPEMCLLDYYLTLPGNKIAVPVILFPYVTPVMFGAYADGTTDDTQAVQQSVEYGMPVNLIGKTYAISDTIDVQTAGLKIQNGGIKMLAQIQGGAFFCHEADNITFDSVTITGTGDSMPIGSGYDYYGIRCYKTDYLNISKCKIKDTSHGGVMVTESSYVNVDDNVIEDMANQSAGASIVVGYAINDADMGHINIRNNTCSGAHFGVETMGWLHDVTINGNDIKDIHGYGINVYLNNSSPTQEFTNVQILNNIVNDVYYNADSGYYNGMGIYVQTIKKVVINGNIVTNTMIGRPDAGSPNRTLSPGAISITGSTEVTCSNNIIEDSVIDGIDIVNVAAQQIGTIVSDNMIRDCGAYGIYGQAIQHAVIKSNTITGTTDVCIGVISHASIETDDIIIDGNMLLASASTSLQIGKGTGTKSTHLNIIGNIATGHTNRGFSIGDLENIILKNNIFHASASVSNYAVYIATASNAIISGNHIDGGASNYYYGGYYLNTVDGIITETTTNGVQSTARHYTLVSSSGLKFYNIMNAVSKNAYSGAYEYTATLGAPVDNRLIMYGTGAPTSGTYARGSIVWNALPNSSGPLLWICTVAGTPGTWVASNI